MIIVAGLFDLSKKTWTLWTNNPKTNPPIIQLPLKFTIFISPTEDEKLKKKPYIFNVISNVSEMCANGLQTLGKLFF